MTAISSIYNISLFLFFEGYIIAGFWAVTARSRGTLNRVFFFVCLSLGIWALSAALSAASPDYMTAMKWQRISTLGWGTLYAVLLHYFIVLTDMDQAFRKFRTLFIIYIPAIVNLFVYGIFTPTAKNEFNLMLTNFGWINIPVSGIWDTFFNVYYISYSAAILLILILWGYRGKGQNIKQVVLISVSFFLAILAGSLLDLFTHRLFRYPLPSFGPFLAVISFSAIVYTTGKYGKKLIKIAPSQPGDDEILSTTEKLNFYRYLGIFIIAGSIMNFGTHFFFHEGLHKVMLLSFGIFLTGLSLITIPRSNLSDNDQDNIMIGIVNVFLIIILVEFNSSSLTSSIIWPIPLLFIIIATVFNKRTFLFSITITAIATQIWLWYKTPDHTVYITGKDHFLRLVTYLAGALTAFFVNRVYLRRLTENGTQLRFQKMISFISSNLVSVSEQNFHERIPVILREMGTYHQAKRVFLFTFSRDLENVTGSYNWQNEKTVSERVVLENKPGDKYPWLFEQITAGQPVYIDNSAALPEKAGETANFLLGKKIESCIFIPVISKEKLLGLIGLEIKIGRNTANDEDYRDILMIPANLMADALIKVDSELKINYMAYYDALTDLPNRTLFEDRLEKAIALAKRNSKFVAVIMFDLDSFKTINDTMGHDAGDILLKSIARRLSNRIRQYDTVSRFGGDEFLFIISQLDSPEEAEIIAANLISALKGPVVIRNKDFYMTASLGVAVYPDDGKDSETLVKNADLAMYISKQRGKNRYTFFSDDMKADTHEKMELTNDLCRALERDEFTIHYQPQIDNESRKITGLEALLRWNHPVKGQIPPDVFIPLAEDAGLITSIGEWVLYTACRQNKILQDRGILKVRIAINLSVKQLNSRDLPETVAGVLDDIGLDPEYLELEITESIAIGGSDSIMKVLQELKDLGITISIDDFGTEYSSLSRLKEMPIDRIKIDKQFIHGISINRNDETITSFIVDLSRNLGIKVIAEGVENDLQLSFLSEKACDEIQGFYFYKPMPMNELEKILTDKTSQSL